MELIRGTTHECFSSYLSNRKQYVHINGVKSAQCKIEIGVPQGSVLVPRLFLLDINDIANSVKKHLCKIMLFADDTNVFIVHKHPIMLKQLAEVIMSDLCDWFITNRLTLSLEKTNFNIFHSPKKKILILCNQLKIGNVNVDRVSCVKYLGVEFDDNLNWNAHVKSVCNVLVKYAGSFKITKGHVPKTCKRQLYFAYIYTKVLIVWVRSLWPHI